MVVVLLLFSVVFRNYETAIVAQVEPVKKAISYQKAVKILEIYVLPGQKIKPGDKLVKVEKQDLLLEIERKKNQLEIQRIEIAAAKGRINEKLKSIEFDKTMELNKIQADIDRANLTIENNKKLSSQFGALTGYSDSISNTGKSYYELELENLMTDKQEIIQKAEEDRLNASAAYEEEMRAMLIKEQESQAELTSLIEEEKQLISFSDYNGTIGTVNVQTGELLTPYTTILSIYEDKPTVIKAVMNENYKYEIIAGQKVKVESTNQKYKIDGEITEIGSRIIEYPSRLQTYSDIPMYGRELFIKIPAENKFLSGERVFVTIEH
ncbi:MAG: HlyD family efflux transporter periplasmic adaptor subunit [Cyclobacteriaceae bacterium]|nr:HlyD family efflux transporter periplasmic adaptor subunit [Cyclobacteriaceae bacterium]